MEGFSWLGQVDLAETYENGNENERGNENEKGKGRQSAHLCACVWLPPSGSYFVL